jgi:hypothetical protein
MDRAGPPLWAALHTLAFAYPEQATAQDRQWSRAFVESLAHLLPCAQCRVHFQRLLEHDLPLRNATRDEFARWTVDAHNTVNARLGKPHVSYEEARRRYALPDDVCASARTAPTRPCAPAAHPRLSSPLRALFAARTAIDVGMIVLTGVLLAAIAALLVISAARAQSAPHAPAAVVPTVRAWRPALPVPARPHVRVAEA